MLDLESFWEYTDPAASETRFRAALASASGDERLELLTQIARTYSLRHRFDEAHALLDQVEADLPSAGPTPRIRYLLERGRTCNSTDTPETQARARTLFHEAWELAQTHAATGLAVDAAHMLAITYAGTPEALPWHTRGLTLARTTHDPKARALIPALLNNAAWDLHELGHFSEALPLFEDALTEWRARGKPQQIQIAQWSVARCLRSLHRYAEALALQRALEAEHAAAGTVDGHVFDELAALLSALDRPNEALAYAEKASAALRKS